MTVLSGIKWRASSSSSWSNLLDITFPTNSIYITYTNNSPANFLGGTWARIGDNRVLIGAGSSYGSGSTGGSANAIVVSHSHTASSASAGAHTHTISASSAGAHTHSTTSAGSHGHSLVWDSGTYNSSVAGIYPIQCKQGATGYIGGGTRVISAGAHTHTASSAGAHTHSGSAASAGAHSHTITVASNGSSGTNANLPPYLGVYFWRRTA